MLSAARIAAAVRRDVFRVKFLASRTELFHGKIFQLCRLSIDAAKPSSVTRFRIEGGDRDLLCLTKACRIGGEAFKVRPDRAPCVAVHVKPIAC